MALSLAKPGASSLRSHLARLREVLLGLRALGFGKDLRFGEFGFRSYCSGFGKIRLQQATPQKDH